MVGTENTTECQVNIDSILGELWLEKQRIISTRS